MTARHASLPSDFIVRLERRLRELEGVDIVIYDVTDKPPATIEWDELKSVAGRERLLTGPSSTGRQPLTMT